MIRSGVANPIAAALASTILLVGAARATAQPAEPPAPPQDPADGAGPQHNDKRLANDPETRRKFREGFLRRLESRRHELEQMEQALKLFDQGKTWEEIRQQIPDLPRAGQRGGSGGGMGDMHDPSNRREPFGGDEPEMSHLGPGGMGGGGPGSPEGAGHERPGSPDQPQRPLTDEDRQNIRDILAVTSPQLLAALRDLEKRNPAEAERKYTDSLPRLRFLLELRKRDALLYELRLKDIQHGREAMDAARAIAALDRSPSPDAAKRTQLEKSLRDSVTAQYSVRTQIMERDADRARQDIEKRSAQAEEVIAKSVRDMIEREKRRADKHPDGDRRKPHADDKP